jgi:CRP-like cAMP-binding protein
MPKVDGAVSREASNVADNPKLDLLRRVPLFTQCRGDSLDLISRLADEVDVADGHVLLRQGDLAQEFFLIVDGRVRIERDGAPINWLGSGDFLGEIALVDEGRRTATAVTEGPAKLLVIAHRDFHSLLDSSPAIRTAIMQGLAARLRRLEPDAAG